MGRRRPRPSFPNYGSGKSDLNHIPCHVPTKRKLGRAISMITHDYFPSASVGMSAPELVLALLIPVAALAALARRLGVPYPILLVLGGLLLGVVPGLPRAELAPDVVFLVFLPPLIYVAAFNSSVRDLRQYAGVIGRLAIGLVIVTTLVVGAVVHAVVPGLTWPVAFLIGAI